MRCFKSLIPLLSCGLVVLLGISGWNSTPAVATPRATEVPATKAAEYGQVADKAVEALIKGDAQTFKSMLSPGTVRMEQRGEGAIDTVISERFIPFFQDFKSSGNSSKAFPTYRRIDNVTGIGFARSFVRTDGSELFYVIFVLDEQGRLTVGNLLLNKKLEDVR